MDDGADCESTVLLVGTGHWANPGLDYRTVEFDDMLAADRQREIEECLARLARFSPTKVALELTGELTEAWNADYRRFRHGSFVLTANERHQLGFRLAAMANLDKIDGIDWHDVHRPIGWERAIAYALAHGQEHLVTMCTAPLQDTATENERIRRMSVQAQLVDLNRPAAMAESHQVYMDLAQVGEGDTYIGAEVVLRWYERNMRMFVNLSRIITERDDRVLVIVGAGHLTLLSHFIQGAGRNRLEQVGDYLT